MKVSVIGAGNVGSAIANTMMLMQVCNNIIVYDKNLEVAQGQAWDISDAIPLIGECQVTATNDYKDLADSEIVVVTIGAKQKEGQTRLELLGENAKIIEKTMKELDTYLPKAIVIIVSNPVDVLTRVAIESSKREPNKIIGSGTILDTARIRNFLGSALGINRKNLHVYIVGEHGDNEFVVWSNAYVSSIKLESYVKNVGMDFEKLKEEAQNVTKKRAYEIINRKGYTSFGIAVSIAKLVKNILRDEKKILPISSIVDEFYALPKGLTLSMPCVIGKNGVERRLLLDFDKEERQKLTKAAQTLNAAFESLR